MRKSRPRSASSSPHLPPHIASDAGEIRHAEPGDAEALGDVLARAFSDDPGFKHVLPDDRDRTERLRVFFETELRSVGIPRGFAWTTEELVGVAVWGPPDRWRVPLTSSLRDGPAMLRAYGRRLPLAVWSRLRMDSRHPKRPPHWYLAVLGVAPEWQGRGLGSLLMRPAFDEMDAAGLPAYLETSTPRARALYERHGFAVTGELNVPIVGPPIWLMWREARRG